MVVELVSAKMEAIRVIQLSPGMRCVNMKRTESMKKTKDLIGNGEKGCARLHRQAKRLTRESE